MSDLKIFEEGYDFIKAILKRYGCNFDDFGYTSSDIDTLYQIYKSENKSDILAGINLGILISSAIFEKKLDDLEVRIRSK